MYSVRKSVGWLLVGVFMLVIVPPSRAADGLPPKIFTPVEVLVDADPYRNAPAKALDYDTSGTFTFDNDIELIQFEVAEAKYVTIFTSSWIDFGNGGGFDPMIGIWDSDGESEVFDDDGSKGGTTISNGISYTHGSWDSYLYVLLEPGTYILSLTQFPNHPFNFTCTPSGCTAGNISDGFRHETDPACTRPYGSQPYFNGVPENLSTMEDPRTGDWEFHLLNVDAVSTDITVPLAPKAIATGTDYFLIGDTVTFDGSASYDFNDDDTLLYAWTFTARPDGSMATLTDADTAAPSFEIDQSGAYEVQLVVSDGLQESPATSVFAYATPPQIDAQPWGAFLEAGEPFRTRLTALGAGDTTYQWYCNEQPVGDDSPIFEIDYVLGEDAGAYTCIVTNANGSVTTTPVRLLVVEGLPASSGLGLLLAVVGIILGALSRASLRESSGCVSKG